MYMYSRVLIRHASQIKKLPNASFNCTQVTCMLLALNTVHACSICNSMSLACYSHWCSGDEVVEVSLEHGKVIVGHFECCEVH